MKKFTILMVIGLCFLSSCKESSEAERSLETDVYRDHSFRLSSETGDVVIDIIARANKITCIDNRGVETVLNKEQMEFCKQLILNDQGYLFDVKKKVLFIPTYRLVFQADARKTTVEVSIPSKQIKFTVGESSKNPRIVILDDDLMSEQVEELFSTIISNPN